MTQTEIESVYTKSDLEPLFLSSEQNYKNSFLDAPSGEYPPQKPFSIYTHNLKKDGSYILKRVENGRATIAVADDEANIVDIFLDTDFQGNGIVEEIVTNLYIDIKDEFINIKNISLASLSSGIIAWHKMGFEFYNLADKKAVRTALSNALGRRVNIKDVTKDEFEEYNLSDVIQQAFKSMKPARGNIPMYREIVR
jgi:hypothetical protein